MRYLRFGRASQRLALGLVLFLFTAPACSRAVNVGTQPTAVFAVSVTNNTAVELIVSYDDGRGPKALGTIVSRGTERFIIAAPAATTVRVSGRSADGSITSGPQTAQLSAGSTTPVVLN
jgi:hypothetical protein